MKALIRTAFVAGLFGSALHCSFGASVVLDSFSEGDFHLQNGGDGTNVTTITSPLALDTREVDARGSGTWEVILASGTGVLNYNVTEILTGAGNSRFSLTMDYTRRSGSWSLLGYDALVFDFPSITGEGRLEIFVNDQNEADMVRVPLTAAASGQLIYPVEDLAASNLDYISEMRVRILPLTDTFSMSLNEITVIPEPSVTAMLIFLIGLSAGRRVRRH